MSFLDLYSGDQKAALKPRPEERPDLPATFADTFKANWDEARLFSQSVAHGTARTEALQDYLDEVQKKTGADLWKKDLSAHLGNPVPFVNGEVAKLKAAQPDLDVQPLTDDGLEQAAIAKSQGARKAYEDMAGRERTWGGTFGALAGSGAGVAMDPINIVTAPVAPAEGLGVLATALRWGVIGAAQNAAIEAVGAPYRETVKPGYLASGEPLANIVEGGAGAAILGGGAKALGNLWSRVKTGSWPTTVRDAGNVIESEANIATTNVLPWVEGEVAHRAALGAAIEQILKGQSVDIQTQVAGRALSARLEREAPFTLPIVNEQAIRLHSEEAGLRARAVELDEHLKSLPEGDISAADRLNRLQAVDQQINEATDAATKKSLNQRRDQILVDTTPEKLRAAAAPIEQRRAVGTEQASISARLSDIATERAKLTPTEPPVNMGQRQSIPRTLYDIHENRIDGLMDMRRSANDFTEQAKAERAAASGGRMSVVTEAGERKIIEQERARAQTELPFESVPTDIKAEIHSNALAHGVAAIAKIVGHDMPREDATKIAQRAIAAKTDDEARGILAQVADRPHTLADTMPSVADVAKQAREDAKVAPQPPTQTPEEMQKTLAAPDHEAAVRSDIDRARMNGDVQIPVGKDENGEPIMGSLDGKIASDVDAYKELADHIQACAAPQPEPEAA